MGTEATIDWSELLAELTPKPGDHGDCYSSAELQVLWKMTRNKTLNLITSAVAAGILAPVKVPVPNAWGDTVLRGRYRLVKTPSKRTAQRDRNRPNAHSHRR